MAFGVRGIMAGSVATILKDREGEVARAVTGAVKTQANILKGDWRSQLMGAGLSPRLANTVRSKVYPQSGYSMRAAALIYPSPGSPATLLEELENSAVITVARGRFLAVPTENVPRGPNRSGRLQPHALEALTGFHLRFAQNRRGTKMLVADAVAARNGRGVRAPTSGRQRQGRKIQTTVFYILVPQVTIKKRLNLKAAAERVGNELGALIAERLG